MEILPFLYLGSAYHASRKDMLDMLGITALINVSANCPNHYEDHYQYKSIPVEDNHKADISSWFNEAIDFIGKTFFFFFAYPLSFIHPSFTKQEQMLAYTGFGRQASTLPQPGFKFSKVPSELTSWTDQA